MSIINQVIEEAKEAKSRYGLFTSTHEAYGVLAEEVLELLEAIRSNDMDAIKLEAVQVSAVAMRLAKQCDDSPDDRDVFHARSIGKSLA